ncbi:MAG: cytochrome c [Pseudomonadales bacterium]|nr:cytochrome c [Pseudomonadales bacterium]
MSTEKLHFRKLIIAMTVLVLILVFASMALSARAASADGGLPVPVSINALMVTLIDHSGHYIWDYGALEREVSAEEWRAVEYYAIQLAAAGPLITLGGAGRLDNTWAASSQWTSFANAMSDAAMLALDAARNNDKQQLGTAGDDLVDSCEGCHKLFKPDTPTEGIMHQPDYDHLYHLFSAGP